MKQVVIENPIINSPFEEPARHFRFADQGITNEVVDGRRISSYFVPIARPKNLIVEVTGEKKKDKAAKVATVRTLWVPAIIPTPRATFPGQLHCVTQNPKLFVSWPICLIAKCASIFPQHALILPALFLDHFSIQRSSLSPVLTPSGCSSPLRILQRPLMATLSGITSLACSHP